MRQVVHPSWPGNAVLILSGAFSLLQSSQKMGLACWQAACPHEIWAQLIKVSLICSVDRRVGTQLMPHICIPERHFAFHSDVENDDYEVTPDVMCSWQGS